MWTSGGRVKAAIAAELRTIHVLVKNDDDIATPMVGLSENLIRASRISVDIWRGVVPRLHAEQRHRRAAGDAINAKLFLPNMATEDFLSCS